uniref:C-type lectin domain-containing protein n=1 Tax=Steinernema glaseri TaxID=37863 RepID=A0A1I7YIV3_9BILA
MEFVQLDNYWLGGQDVKNDGSWTWIDGSAFSYNNWASGGGVTGKDCLLVDRITGLWQANDCQRKATFMCETKLLSTTTTMPTTPTTTTSTTTTTTTTTTTAVPTCNEGYYYNGKCYVLVETSYTWDDALSNCQNNWNNGNLASIHSAQMEAIIRQQMSNVWYWIGGQFNEYGQLRWTDGTDVDYTPWLPDQPFQTSDNRCVAVENRENGWENLNCANEYPSVCAILV